MTDEIRASRRIGLQRGFGLFLIITGLISAQLLMSRAEALESVQSDLQKIVVLCATEPGSPRFDAAWTAWVRDNPDADLERTIDTVLSRAGTIRSMSVSGLEPKKPDRQPSTDVIADRMRALGTAARARPARSIRSTTSSSSTR